MSLEPPPPLPCSPPLKKAASSVLAACSSSSTPTGHPRRRIRSLASSGANGAGAGGRFMPDNGNTGGSSSRGGSGSSHSSKGAGGGGGGGRGRGRNGSSGNGSNIHGIVSSSAAGDLESAPRSGSSLDARGRGTEEAATVTGVVKRGGSLRWLSPTDPTAAGGTEVRESTTPWRV